jgi:hypothetical protein
MPTRFLRPHIVAALAVGLALVTSVVFGYVSGRQSGGSVAGRWAFTATIDTPSTTIDGKMNVLLDSGGIIIGAFKMERHIVPFRGRHLDRRIVARSDSGFRPVVRLDCTTDSTGVVLNGLLQISSVRAVDHHNRATDYKDLLYQFYGLRE